MTNPAIKPILTRNSIFVPSIGRSLLSLSRFFFPRACTHRIYPVSNKVRFPETKLALQWKQRESSVVKLETDIQSGYRRSRSYHGTNWVTEDPERIEKILFPTRYFSPPCPSPHPSFLYRITARLFTRYPSQGSLNLLNFDQFCNYTLSTAFRLFLLFRSLLQNGIYIFVSFFF